MNKNRTVRPAGAIRCATWIVLPIVVAFIALGIGRINISPADLFGAFFAKISGNAVGDQAIHVMTIFNFRLPRILTALLIGAGLSVAGCSFQSLFANPLATPDTVGVASGASFGAALGILLGVGLIGTQMISFAFGAVAVGLTWLAAAGRGRRLGTVVLSGIMIGSLFSALVSLVKFVADEESKLPAITYWLMGSFNAAGYRGLKYAAPAIILGMIILFLIRWRLNLLPLGEDEARSSGVNIVRLRAVTVISATLITASCVSLCGQVGWVGLLVPHICRMLYGNDHRALIPASASFGAAFMVVVDTLARSISAADIPISVLTAIIGAPFFIVIMRRSRGWSI